jgi:hypothetical protein
MPVLRAFDEGVEGKRRRYACGLGWMTDGATCCRSLPLCCHRRRGRSRPRAGGSSRCCLVAVALRARSWRWGGGGDGEGLGLAKEGLVAEPKIATKWNASSTSNTRGRAPYRHQAVGEQTACRGELRQCVLRPCQAAARATLFNNTAGLLASMTVSCV